MSYFISANGGTLIAPSVLKGARKQITIIESPYSGKNNSSRVELDPLVPFAVCWWELNIFSAFWMAFQSKVCVPVVNSVWS